MALAFILRFEGGMPTTKTLWAWVRTARSEHSRAIGVRSTSTLFNEASARERARQEAVSRHPGRRGGGGGAHLRRPHLALRRLRSTSIFFRPCCPLVGRVGTHAWASGRIENRVRSVSASEGFS